MLLFLIGFLVLGDTAFIDDDGNVHHEMRVMIYNKSGMENYYKCTSKWWYVNPHDVITSMEDPEVVPLSQK